MEIKILTATDELASEFVETIKTLENFKIIVKKDDEIILKYS